MTHPNRHSGTFASNSHRMGSMSASDVQSPSFLPESANDWIQDWSTILAKSLAKPILVEVDSEITVEEACDTLLTKDTSFLYIRPGGTPRQEDNGLFDFSDVNAFLTLAATRHQFSEEYLGENPKVNAIVEAAKAGRVSVELVSNLSQKNPLESLPSDSTILDLLRVFSGGIHRCLITSDDSASYLGYVSDARLLRWFEGYASNNESFRQYLFHGTIASTSTARIPSRTGVISATSEDSVLFAMKRMSEEGVSSVAVLENSTGEPRLLSAVSVRDIGNLVVSAPDNQILTVPLHQFIAQIKHPHGVEDGVDKYPVYAVQPASRLSFTIEKLLATNAHRLFLSDAAELSSNGGNPIGVVSLVDILSLFARIAGIPNVDPGRMRHRRRSSSASAASDSHSPLTSWTNNSQRRSWAQSSSSSAIL
ncbi:hypothetical protein DL96DRAFT_1598081 [Flagelloscypha sp. PMI_526]|nr:hypothetical protein DL96DRAFT_1598081 [Flagelloscypha sp. PMI_526]